MGFPSYCSFRAGRIPKDILLISVNTFRNISYKSNIIHSEAIMVGNKDNLSIFTLGEVINLTIIIGIAVVITIFSIEVQLRKLNKTNQKIVELLNEIKKKE
ncbi:hypothetical protein [Mesobacillus selenatarsenatis]|uniref:hypothetical protein n=1 Tax=Mesobacillus selenatarsenatis TaxID=388741 RepID=UPI0005AA8384|nr:hypothetical protein [Mesobacillus selenatarsenatis]